MSRIAARTREELHQVLLHFGIMSPDLHDIRTGRVNKHWRVESGADRYVLRRYNPHRSPDAVQYEHDVLHHIERKGWPVAVPLPAEGGATFVQELGSSYSLFPFLPGRPGPPHSQRYLQIKGGLLARLHRDLALLPAKAQRHGFGRLSDLDAYIPVPSIAEKNKPGGSLATFDAITDAFGQEQPRLASRIQSYRQANLDELDRLDYKSLPDVLVHGDFHGDHTRFQRRQLTAVLDFDLVHLDARVADVALAIAGDCLEPPAYMSIDPEAVQAFVGAYHSKSPLSEPEVGLIVPLIRAYYLWLCWFNLTRWLDGDVEKATRSLARTLQQRLPNLETCAPAIATALRAVTA